MEAAPPPPRQRLALIGQWQHDDFDVFDGDRLVGRVYLVDSMPARTWFGACLDLTHRKSYGHTPSLDEAMAAWRAEHKAWKSRG